MKEKAPIRGRKKENYLLSQKHSQIYVLLVEYLVSFNFRIMSSEIGVICFFLPICVPSLYSLAELFWLGIQAV
jgi:hypothetical protein